MMDSFCCRYGIKCQQNLLRNDQKKVQGQSADVPVENGQCTGALSATLS